MNYNSGTLVWAQYIIFYLETDNLFEFNEKR